MAKRTVWNPEYILFLMSNERQKIWLWRKQEPRLTRTALTCKLETGTTWICWRAWPLCVATCIACAPCGTAWTIICCPLLWINWPAWLTCNTLTTRDAVRTWWIITFWNYLITQFQQQECYGIKWNGEMSCNDTRILKKEGMAIWK